MKVSVIGAGAAGLLTAFHLGELGHSVTLFESNPDVYTHFTGELTGGAALEVIPGECIDARFSRSRIISLDSGKEIDVPGEMVLISADRFKLAMLEKVEGAGVRVRYDSQVTGVKTRWASHGSGPEPGPLHRGDDLAVLVGNEHHHCDLIVGADGSGSLVGRECFPDPGFRILKAIRFKIRGRHTFDPDTAYFFIGSEVGLGYLWCYPRTARDVNIGVGSIHGAPLLPILERFIERGFEGRDYRIIARGGDQIPYTGLRRVIADRDVALVGNAAGQVSCLLGGGMEASVEGVRSLVRAASGGFEFDPVLYRNDYCERYPRVQRAARIVPPMLRIHAAGRIFDHLDAFMGIVHHEDITGFVSEGNVARSASRMALMHPLLSLRLLVDYLRGGRIMGTTMTKGMTMMGEGGEMETYKGGDGDQEGTR